MPVIWDAFLRFSVAFVSRLYCNQRIVIGWLPFLHSFFHFCCAHSHFSVSEFLNHYFFDWETKMHKGYFHMCFPQPSCFAWSSLGLRVCSCGCGAGCHARGYRSLPWHTDDSDHSHRGKPVLHCSWVTATIFVLWLCPACLQFAWLQYFFYFI